MGGNVFKGLNSTHSIKLNDILPTVRWLEKITSLSLSNNLLGSTGKKAISNDIDIGIDQNITSKDQLINSLSNWILKYDYTINNFIRKSGISVHFRSPIAGNINGNFVQIDFMFVDDINFMKFSLSADSNSVFSGADRNMLMSSIAKSIPGDFKYSWQKGLIQRSTGELISKDPDYIAKFLLGDNYLEVNLKTVESIMAAIKPDQTRLTNLFNLTQILHSSENKVDLYEYERLTKILI